MLCLHSQSFSNLCRPQLQSLHPTSMSPNQSLAVSSGQKAPVQPIKMSALWTFALALALLQAKPERPSSLPMDEFLTHNKAVLLLPQPFAALGSSSETVFPKDVLEITLRGVVYSGLTLDDLRIAAKVTELLNVEHKEVLRIISQTKARISAAPLPKSSLLGILSRLPDNSALEAEKALIQTYVSAILAERRIILRLLVECFNSRFDGTASAVVREIGNAVLVRDDYVTSAIDCFDRFLESDTEFDDLLQMLTFREELAHIINLLKFSFEIIHGNIRKTIVQKWFTIMQRTSFASSLRLSLSEKESFACLSAICTVISLQLLDLDHYFTEQDINLYLDDPQVFQLVDETIAANSRNHVIQYAWLLMIYRKFIVLEEFQQANDKFLAVVSLSNVQQSIFNLRRILHDASIFQEISELHRVLSFDDVFLVSISTLLLQAIPLITVTDEVARCYRDVFTAAPNFCKEKFFANPEIAKTLTLARAKFPYSLSQFLCFLAINGVFAYEELKMMKSYMCEFPSNTITNYEIDSDNTDLIKITSSLDVYPPYESKNKLSFYLQEGTKAKVINIDQSSNSVVMFLHNYNGWAFLGRVIENVLKSFDSSCDEKILIVCDTMSVIERVCEQRSAPKIRNIFEYMSLYTDDSDFVDILFRMLEQSMHNRCLDLSEKVLRIMVHLMPIIPQRIWSYLSASTLLPANGKEGLISVFFGSIESKRGLFNFTLALVKFVAALADNCLSETNDYSESAKGEILAGFVKHLNFVLESSVNCKFADGRQKLELGLLIFSSFKKIVGTIYCIGADSITLEKPTRVFLKASNLILETFLNTESKVTRSAELIFQLIDLLASPESAFEANDPSSFLLSLWIDSAFSFTNLILTVRGAFKGLTLTSFERQVFSKLPQLVKIYLEVGHRKEVLNILSTLMAAKYKEGEAPSMLSHLGSQSSNSLLHSLATDLSNPFDDHSIKIAIYDFLCVMMEHNQHGLSVLLISGRNVFGEFSADKDNLEYSGAISLLKILKLNVNQLQIYPEAVSVHLLDCLALVLNSWTAARNNDSDIEFLSRLISTLKDFQKPCSTNKEFDLIIASYKCKVISKIAEILSLIFFTTKNEECEKAFVQLLSNDTFISSLPLMFLVIDYDTEIYRAVHSRFESVFPNFKLSQFTTNFPKRNRFGAETIYDLPIMDSLFGKHPEWTSIRQEIIKCGENIQYFNAQVALSKSLGALLTSYCRRALSKLTSSFFDLIPLLLTIRDPVDEYSQLFESQQFFERTGLSFYLCYAVNNVNVTKSPTTAISIFSACVDILKTKSNGKNLEKKKGESDKTLMRICFLALSNLKNASDLISTNFHIFEEFFDCVIAQGVTNIVVDLQNDVYLSRTKKQASDLNGKLDFLRLILSTLKVVLSFDMILSLRTKLIDSLVKHGTVDALRSLYSFSHLIMVNDDPVFAQLSLMFTLQLMLVDLLLQQFVDSKSFIVIRESVITQPLREGGINIENAPQLHQNWTNGILPILVTCLAKGQKLNEVLLTLKAFSRQIEYCIELWAGDSSSLKISSACVLETAQIIYLYRFLSSLAQSQEFAAVCPSDVDMPFIPGLDTSQKREEFMNFFSNLLKHPKFLMSRIVPSSAEEKVLMKANDNGFVRFRENLYCQKQV